MFEEVPIGLRDPKGFVEVSIGLRSHLSTIVSVPSDEDVSLDVSSQQFSVSQKSRLWAFGNWRLKRIEAISDIPLHAVERLERQRWRCHPSLLVSIQRRWFVVGAHGPLPLRAYSLSSPILPPTPV